MTPLAHLTGIRFEGNLIVPDMAADLASGELKGQAAADFGLQKNVKLEDEMALAWGDAKDYWNIFQRRLSQLDPQDLATSLTRDRWVVPLLKLLGYDPIYTAKAAVVEGQTFAISHRAELGEERPPVHAIACRVGLEQRPPSGTPRLSAHALMQEYLNRTEHLWGVVTNGLQWRLLRDCSLMTRLTYIEFDLESILTNENFAEFQLFYRLFHRTRLPQDAQEGDLCLLEFYHQEAQQQGGRVRDKLRDGVENAIVQLADGFLQHPENQGLRDRLSLKNKISPSPSGKGSEGLTAAEFYRFLLLLIYRLLFLMVAESRELLLAGDDPNNHRIYREYYSIERLRALAEPVLPSSGRSEYRDLWQGLQVTFRLFDEQGNGTVLGLSPLNGDLFGANTLAVLEECALDNHSLLRAVRSLSLYEERARSRRVNYAALDVEELGSVYESLLDLSPQVQQSGGIYQFRFNVGTERKTTGAYYTPQALVAQLVKSALDPVIENALQAGDNLETALLSLKVCDPACGSGHFLLAAARRIGKELARVRTGELQPGGDMLRRSVRDAIQNCIYGVDINPLAVDLCKVALWIEGFSRGMPLNFLDHRIKCGNSLVGVLDLDCLDEGIPDNAFKAVTGDEKTVASNFKKRNQNELKNIEQGQLELNLFDTKTQVRQDYVSEWQKLVAIPETTTEEIRRKKEAYQLRHSAKNAGWWRDFTACNLWTAAFFMPLTEQNLQLIPTSAGLKRLLNSAEVEQLTLADAMLQQVVEAANQLAADCRFFHWALEFPEVFDQGGFSCVLGNPPWERIKLEEKEFFADKDEAIVTAKNSAARKKLIANLLQTHPQLAQAWEDAKHFADAQGKFVRESGRFPLTAMGDINTYAVFAETVRKLINKQGYLGVVLPSAIATGDTTKDFFGDLIQQKSIVSLLGFTNWAFIFPDVGHRFAFCLLTLSGPKVNINQAKFIYHCHYFKDLEDKERYFLLSKDDIELINPNTLTCPIFRTQIDAEISNKIYREFPVLENEQTGDNPWGISFMTMFHMSNDSNVFFDDRGENRIPLYEAKMFHIYNHRYGFYTGEMLNSDQTNFKIIPTPSLEQYQDPSFCLNSRYWVERAEVENRLAGKWDKEWLLAFRGITLAVNERTNIPCLLPKVATGNSAPLILLAVENTQLISCFLGSLSSLIFDFVTRQKVGGTNFNFFIVKQLPVIPPETYTPEDIKYISSRVLELVYTSYDLQPFAQDMGYEGEPFIWNETRRAVLRAELDAYYAKLYGLTRDELRYILDPADVYGEDFPSETFRVLKNNEVKKYGEYRTQRLVLAAFDRL
ncbi:Eco57I restriction-modification methylase domain-containing protein [Laspinema olomoucense]|uniref:site-specific DNA-methyltransferase (adenine-specific) n=1 Tax=Laspinema olomoucense D3b TaxID=2953688 RepID=A0ABT2NF59_9CYAN|nr:N-6 DNA methylase [Laspinema sp. D3b]MCT7981343.1 N-6 DNA methylase [Laspinema sp. D3b]